MTNLSANLEVRQLLSKGTAALQRGKHNEALNYLEQAYSLEPENPDVVLNLSGALILAKKFKRAAVLLEDLIKQQGYGTLHSAMVWTNLGAAYLGNPVLAQDADQRKAIEAFKRALEINPTAPNVAYNLGLIYRDRKDFVAAQQWFKQAVRTNPNDDDARLYLQEMTAALEDKG